MSKTTAATTTASGGGGVTFLQLLTIAFVVLKLCGVIAWSWWWVLAPLWIPFSIFFAIVAIVILVIALTD